MLRPLRHEESVVEAKAAWWIKGRAAVEKSVGKAPTCKASISVWTERVARIRKRKERGWKMDL